MPNSRCIETWARERVYLGTQVPVTDIRAWPGSPVDRGPCIAFERCENGAFWILFRLDLYENPILEGSKRLRCI